MSRSVWYSGELRHASTPVVPFVFDLLSLTTANKYDLIDVLIDCQSLSAYALAVLSAARK